MDLGPVAPTPRRALDPDPGELGDGELIAAMLAAARRLGHPRAAPGVHGGRLVHDVLPSSDQAADQLSGSSEVALDWHTEDAFLDVSPSHLVLGCVRNPDATATRISVPAIGSLPRRLIEALRRPWFRFVPDPSYVGPCGAICRPLLYGDGAEAWVRYDAAYLEIAPEDEGDRALAEEAYVALGEAIERSAIAIRLAPGDLLLLDNRRVVHGREAFVARYDGTDRWLKRVFVFAEGSRAA